MALETFGAMALVVLALPFLTAKAAATPRRDQQQRQPCHGLKVAGLEGGSGGGSSGSRRVAPSQGGGAGVATASPTAVALLTFQLARSLTAFAATLSAGVQRRHLYAWALFAPKFVFEAAFLLVTDVLLLLAAG